MPGHNASFHKGHRPPALRAILIALFTVAVLLPTQNRFYLVISTWFSPESLPTACACCSNRPAIWCRVSKMEGSITLKSTWKLVGLPSTRRKSSANVRFNPLRQTVMDADHLSLLSHMRPSELSDCDKRVRLLSAQCSSSGAMAPMRTSLICGALLIIYSCTSNLISQSKAKSDPTHDKYVFNLAKQCTGT